MADDNSLEDDIHLVRVLIGDTESSMFYPLLSDEDIEKVLDLSHGSVLKCAKRCAISASFLLSTFVQRSRVEGVEEWNTSSKDYRATLEAFISSASSMDIPNKLLPFAAGIGPDSPNGGISPLMQITPCNAYWTKKVYGRRGHTDA